MRVQKGNGLPSFRDRIISLTWLPQKKGVAVAECSEIVREVNAGLTKRLKERKKRASKTLKNEKGDAITACCFEAVQLS
jgi:hypothetical protein